MRIVHVSQLGYNWTVAYKRDGENNWLGDCTLDELDDAIARAKYLTYPVVAVFKATRWNYGHPDGSPRWIKDKRDKSACLIRAGVGALINERESDWF